MNVEQLKVLKTAYLDIFLAIRPEVVDNNIKDPHWLVDFTKGETCFFIYVTGSFTC